MHATDAAPHIFWTRNGMRLRLKTVWCQRLHTKPRLICGPNSAQVLAVDESEHRNTKEKEMYIGQYIASLTVLIWADLTLSKRAKVAPHPLDCRPLLQGTKPPLNTRRCKWWWWWRQRLPPQL